MAKKKAKPGWIRKWPRSKELAEARFNKFVKPFQGRLWHMALKIAYGNRAVAEDLLANATLKIVSGTGKYQKGRPREHFAMHIARNSMLNNALEERTRKAAVKRYVEVVLSRKPGAKDILREMGKLKERDIIRVVKMLVEVSDLSLRDKAMFLYHTGLGGKTKKKYKETGVRFNVPTGTAQRVIFNARKKLKEMLSQR